MDDNKLTVSAEDGKRLDIDVIDIIDANNRFNKEYIIYTISGNKDNVFASVLKEDDNSFTLETIPTQEEYEFVNSRILELNLDTIEG